jgi:membrane protein YdbS with pleckstrin-like domain
MPATPEERIVIEARRHGIVLARPLARAGLLAVAGGACVVAGWPFSPAGAPLLLAAALAAVAAVWRWDRTQIVLTTEKLFVVHGVLRRHAAAVRLERVGTVELEQTLLGRLLGYGTVVAGDLEISYVAEPREVYGLVERLSH